MKRIFLISVILSIFVSLCYAQAGFIERSMLVEKIKYEIKNKFGKEFLYKNGKARDLKEIETDPKYQGLSSYEKDCFKLWYWDEIIKNMPEFEKFSYKERLATFYGFINEELSDPEVKNVMKELIERGKESVLEEGKKDDFKFSPSEFDSL
jgi:hypothetical protein